MRCTGDVCSPGCKDWYAARCDGDWEHRHGIDIGTLDNPGWSVRIALTGTGLEGRPLTQVVRGNPHTDADWLHCRVDDQTFHGAGGAQNLTEILATFRAWIKDG